LKRVDKGSLNTRRAVQSLKEHGLLEEWSFSVSSADGASQINKGLFKIDQKRLAALTGDELAQLRDHNALPLIYSQLMSMQRIMLLKKLHQHHQQESQRDNAQQIEETLSEYLGDSMDEVISFDFD